MEKVLTFKVQEIRNILRGIEREAPELDVLDASADLYVTRDMGEKTFRIYAVNPEEEGDVDPLVYFNPAEEHEFAFFNRYFMVRDPEFDTGKGSDPTDIPGVG